MFSGMDGRLATISFVALFLGTVSLTWRLARYEGKESPDRLAFSALVTLRFTCVAVLIAAAVRGFIVRTIMRHMARDTESNLPQYRLIIDALFQVNEAFSRIFSVAVLIAILLWSISALRNG